MTAKMAALIRRARKNADSDDGSNDQEHDDLLELIALIEKPSKHKHRFALVPNFADHQIGAPWQWCVRCGCLKRNKEVFSPGEHQKAIITADK
jgi:hypothetical protein